jgi:hypothetical protein
MEMTGFTTWARLCNLSSKLEEYNDGPTQPIRMTVAANHGGILTGTDSRGPVDRDSYIESVFGYGETMVDKVTVGEDESHDYIVAERDGDGWCLTYHGEDGMMFSDFASTVAASTVAVTDRNDIELFVGGLSIQGHSGDASDLLARLGIDVPKRTERRADRW